MKRICKHYFCLVFMLIAMVFMTISASAAGKSTRPVIRGQNIKITGNKATVTLGSKPKLYATVSGKRTAVSWKSSKPSVATVSKNGSVTLKKSGVTFITAKKNKKTSLRMRLTVKKKAASKKTAATPKRTGQTTGKTGIVAMKKLQCYSAYRKKYMSEAQFKAAYNKALPIVRKALGKSGPEQLRIVARELRIMAEDGRVSYSMKKQHYNDPYGYLVKGAASCAGCARTVRMCLNMLGYSCTHVNENRYVHQWARVKVAGKYWICDPYGLYVAPELQAKKFPSNIQTEENQIFLDELYGGDRPVIANVKAEGKTYSKEFSGEHAGEEADKWIDETTEKLFQSGVTGTVTCWKTY